MATALFDKIIFGPIKSRRLGTSLGVNLLSTDQKLCNFECIYCECGWSGGSKAHFNKKADVLAILREQLLKMKNNGEKLDVITFAGNGEPTMHPEFASIIDATIDIRNEIYPEAKIAVLSNATMIGREEVREALKRVDRNILKLDSAFDSTVKIINEPNGNYSVAETVDNMKKFEGKLIIQTMFIRGEYGGNEIDNTINKEVSAWLELVKDIAPEQVMIYTIDRDTPAENLTKVSVDEMKLIAERVKKLGIDCSVSG